MSAIIPAYFRVKDAVRILYNGFTSPGSRGTARDKIDMDDDLIGYSNWSYSVVFYVWEQDLSPHHFHDLMTKVIDCIPVTPKDVTITTSKALPPQSYKNYIKKYPALAETLRAEYYHWFDGPRSDPRSNISLYWTQVVGMVGLHFRETQRGEYREGIASAIRTLVVELKPSYGIGYAMDINDGPEEYADGTLYSTYYSDTGKLVNKHAEEIDDLQKFQMVLYKNKRTGILKSKLRGVYDTNFLGRSHLDAPVSETTLRQLIGNLKVGELQQVNPELWQWTLNEADQARAASLLKGSGIFVTEYAN